MLCELCGKEDNCIYITSRYNFICGECYRKIKNGNEERLKQHEEMLEMYKRYGIKI